MKIIKDLNIVKNYNDLRYDYNYRIVASSYEGIDAYGIEIERKDFNQGVLVNVERDLIHKISCQLEKVKELTSVPFRSRYAPPPGKRFIQFRKYCPDIIRLFQIVIQFIKMLPGHICHSNCLILGLICILKILHFIHPSLHFVCNSIV